MGPLSVLIAAVTQWLQPEVDGADLQKGPMDNSRSKLLESARRAERDETWTLTDVRDGDTVNRAPPFSNFNALW